MGLYTMFGINGIGKDTVAEEIRKKRQNIEVTSLSRLLMFILGISKSYDVREKINEEQYKALEETPQSTMRSIEDNEYRQLLEQLAKGDKDVIFLSHLITALRLGNNVEFLEDRKTPDWFVDINDKLIQLVAPAQIVAERRQKDKTRRRCYEIDEIIKHQELCTKEWERIKRKDYYTAKKMSVVENIDLNQAVREVENIIFTRNKGNRAKFVQGLRVQVGCCDKKINNESIIERGEEGNER